MNTTQIKVINDFLNSYPTSKIVDSALKRCLQYFPFMQNLEFFGALTSHPIVIAGGAVRDFLMFGQARFIKDIDIFVLQCKDTDLNKEAQIFTQCLSNLLLSTKPKNEKGMPYTCLTGYDDNNALIDTVPQWNEQMSYDLPPNIHMENKTMHTQIIFSKAESVEDLLETFDWGACKFAFDGKRVLTPGLDDYKKGYLQLGHTHDPMRALRRGFYLEEKYKYSEYPIVLRREEVIALTALMIF